MLDGNPLGASWLERCQEVRKRSNVIVLPVSFHELVEIPRINDYLWVSLGVSETRLSVMESPPQVDARELGSVQVFGRQLR